MKPPIVRRRGRFRLLAAVLSPALAAQQPDDEFATLTQRFLTSNQRERLEIYAALAAGQDRWLAPIAERVHGRHREFQLQIERLLSQLADERWLAREEAERELGEVGARARALIEERRLNGATLEERLRCERVLRVLDARGTTREDNELAILRGLVHATLYLRPDPRLATALRSAIDHADFDVVEGALRALGTHGGDADADLLQARVAAEPPLHRATALAALVRLPGARALAHARELLLGGKLAPDETVLAVRALHARDDAVELLAACRQSPDRVLATAAAHQPIAALAATPIDVMLTDGAKLTGTFEGIAGDGLLLGRAIEGLDRIELPLRLVALVQATGSPEVARPDCRLALLQGTVLGGRLDRITADAIRIESPRFGTIEVLRSRAQGMLLDPALDRILGAQAGSDRLRLRGGEQVDGAIAGVERGVVQTGERQVPLAQVATIAFARPSGGATSAQIWTRVETHDGDRLLGLLGRAEAGGIGIHVPDAGATSIPLADVRRIEFAVGGGAQWGFTLIADYSDNLVIEVDDQGREVFRLEDAFGAWDAECLDNGNVLVVEFAASRVVEVDRSGKDVWVFQEGLRNPTDADRLPNGNTLIADAYRQRVIEVDRDKKIVWQFGEGIRPYDVERLPSGNTLIADILKDRVLEVDPAGKIVWEIGQMPHVHDVDRLPNGNTLVTLRTLRRVVEVDRAGQVVWRLDGLDSPSDADRLPNGNTLVAVNGAVQEYDRSGRVVWSRAVQWALEANRY
jgi:hypothetical protein